MPSAKLYHEEYRVNPIPFDPESDTIQIHSAFHSCWRPGFIAQGSNGKYVVCSLVKSGAYRSVTSGGIRIYRGVCFTCGSGKPSSRSETVGTEDLIRKAVMLHRTAFQEAMISHFLPLERSGLSLSAPERVEKVLDDIYDELGRKFPDQARLSGLFVQMLQEVSDQQRGSSHPEPLVRTLKFIIERLSDPELSRQEIAAACGMSFRTLSRRFRQHLGTSVTQYVIAKRLEKACGMLALPMISIKEIALQCGFRNSGILARKFRQHYKMSPKEFRDKFMKRQ